MAQSSGIRVVLPGGAGQVGTMLARHFHAKGDSVVVLSRHPVSPPGESLRGTESTSASGSAKLTRLT
jgi:uncharacterized protein YbjT (DUF2867 family)